MAKLKGRDCAPFLFFHSNGAEHHALSCVTVFVHRSKIAVNETGSMVVDCYHIAIAAGCLGVHAANIRLALTGGMDNLNAIFPLFADRIEIRTNKETGSSVAVKINTIF